MEFTTFDIEFADVILPSICSIAIIDWKDGEIINEYSTKINPDCEIEDFLKDRHGLTMEDLKNSPTLPEIWIEIYDRLENKIVFGHNANRNVRALRESANILYLNMPTFIYCCTASLSKKLWPYLNDFSLPYISERLGINNVHYNSYEDAKSVGRIINKAIEDTGVKSISEMFSLVGFSGGLIDNKEKSVYRAIKRKGKYKARIKNRKTGEIKYIDFFEAESQKDDIKTSIYIK